MIDRPRFNSAIHGGFECSSQLLKSGRRLDLLNATRHAEFVRQDYTRLAGQGILTVREGLVWHRVERHNGFYEFATALRLLRAARAAGVQIIWDLCHFGWPDGLDPLRPAFVTRFARMAAAFAELLQAEGEREPMIAPIDQISFLSRAGAEIGSIHPFLEDRGFEFKCQLVRATIAAIDAIRAICPLTRFFQIEPACNVVAAPGRPEDAAAAEGCRQAQFEVWDMLRGELWPQLGGTPSYLDVIGLGWHPWDQWSYERSARGGATIDSGHPGWRRFDEILAENFARYGRPLYVAATGCENERRAPWLASVCAAVRRARARDLPVDGVCLYPILNSAGSDGERQRHDGLWDRADDHGERAIYPPLAAELARQRELFGESLAPSARQRAS